MEDYADLGFWSEPVLICGGAYGNLEALDAFLCKAETMGIPPCRIIHTGDAVAYCADAAAAVSRLAGSGIHCLKGNVEAQLVSDADDCGCGFEEGTSCDALSAAWYGHAKLALSDGHRNWMRNLPNKLRFNLNGRSLMAVHGSVSDISRFLFASHPDEVFNEELDMSCCDGVIGGHCGLPFTRLSSGRIWHNSGALGMPANDGTPRVWFSKLAPHGDGIRITHHALDYPYDVAAAKMRKAGLPEEYVNALGTGLWPGLDILPAMEKRRSGSKLVARSYFWQGDGTLNMRCEGRV